jgi:ribosomal-protein-alanine N-acetyltransferase
VVLYDVAGRAVLRFEDIDFQGTPAPSVHLVPPGARSPKGGVRLGALKSVCATPTPPRSRPPTSPDTGRVIETPRLTLHPLSPALLALLVAGDIDGARATDPPYAITETTFAGDDHVLRLRLAQVTRDPTEEPWLYRVAVLKGTREVVGRAGFHAPPDAEGVVEIGYSTAPEHRRRGYALEMTTALLAWGTAHGATRCLASVRPDNEASLAMIAKLGFVKVGEQMDEIDGLEWVHSLTLR